MFNNLEEYLFGDCSNLDPFFVRFEITFANNFFLEWSALCLAQSSLWPQIIISIIIIIVTVSRPIRAANARGAHIDGPWLR